LFIRIKKFDIKQVQVYIMFKYLLKVMLVYERK